MAQTLTQIYAKDPDKPMRRKRFSFGTVADKAGNPSGGMVELNVGAKLADGTAQTFTIPLARGITAVAGQMLAIVYPNDSPHSAYATVLGNTSGAAP